MSESQFLLQLAGAPGAGKSVLAAAIAQTRPAAIVNSDVVKSTLLDAGIAWRQAGPAAYQVLFALADDLLAQGHSVILDSPSHYAFIPENGARVAVERGVPYRFLELVCPDVDELKRRLAARVPRRSQMRGLDEPPPDSDGQSKAKRVGVHQWETARPASGFLVLDTSQPLSEYLAQALAFLDGSP